MGGSLQRKCIARELRKQVRAGRGRSCVRRRCAQASAAAGRGAQSENQVDRGNEKERRGVETRSRARNHDGGYRSAAEDGSEGVADAVQEHDDGEEVGEGAKGAGIAKGEGSEKQENEIHDD